VEARFIYITCEDKAEALRLGKVLLQNHLVACINVREGMTSAYWWKGEMVEAKESILIAKSREEQVPALVQKVKEVHSYEVPCVVSLAIDGGNPTFLQWIGEQTGAKEG